jgi:hypothetical protein
MDTMALIQTRVPKIITTEYVITSPMAGVWQFRKDASDNRYTVVHHYSSLYGDAMETDKVKLPPYWSCEDHGKGVDCEHIKIIKSNTAFQEQQSILKTL